MPEPGEVIDAVRAVGKHLLIDFSGGLTVRTHLRMHGRWQLFRNGEPWRRSPTSARVIVEVADAVAVCFSAPDVAITRHNRVATNHLGPDLCEPNPDFDAVLMRLGLRGTCTIGEALLDQRVAAGIGNVYKSETLFAERVDPTTPVGELSPAQLRAIFERAHQLMRANLDRPGPRRTTAQGYAVYRRGRRPCPTCDTPITRITQGIDQPRSTYYCPACQGRR